MASKDGHRSGCPPLSAPAVRADDELIERLRRGEVPTCADPLVRLLAAWRAEVAAGIDAGIDTGIGTGTDTAMTGGQ
ncbi:hypothetical protein SAMN05443637_11956 [Pseudonocardia thermophila]|jgi:hypothetical protein|uniref:Uncharacterized protein n=1 Tax=Pseudonocardia thermophila TaxID=1848 RepID=A0A1M6Y8U2_PSETH|nr:hypothetical protein [Pseudonocardia thermophila]SHL14667.1 hypothetical protein SAMN05443637_11956 [Pseudonocardia thermophila]